MFNTNEVSKMAKGYALVTGDKVEVMVGKTIRDVAAIQARLNRFAPLTRTKVYEARFEYVSMGRLENVKLGKYVF